jgi:hypothetical protein
MTCQRVRHQILDAVAREGVAIGLGILLVAEKPAPPVGARGADAVKPDGPDGKGRGFWQRAASEAGLNNPMIRPADGR